MRTLPSSVLADPTFRVPVVPPAPPGAYGLAWLRAHVARFSEGDDHVRRRALAAAVIADLDRAVRPAADPTLALVRACGLADHHAHDVALVAAAYQPHAPQGPAADDAVVRLVEKAGARDEGTAALIGVLVQAHAAVHALVAQRRGDAPPGPPVPATRRVGPTGEEVAVDLTDAPFGRGPHACPGRALALRLAEACS